MTLSGLPVITTPNLVRNIGHSRQPALRAIRLNKIPFSLLFTCLRMYSFLFASTPSTRFSSEPFADDKPNCTVKPCVPTASDVRRGFSTTPLRRDQIYLFFEVNIEQAFRAITTAFYILHRLATGIYTSDIPFVFIERAQKWGFRIPTRFGLLLLLLVWLLGWGACMLSVYKKTPQPRLVG